MIHEIFGGCLIPGKTYRVKKVFLDSGKTVHQVGESWKFLGYASSGFSEQSVIYANCEDSSKFSFAISWNELESNLTIDNAINYFEEVL